MRRFGRMGRREFLARTGAGIAASAAPAIAQTRPTGKGGVRFGLIGCGGRGRGVAKSMIENADAQLVALADLFGDKLAAHKEYFDGVLAKRGLPPIDPKRLHKGHDSAEQLAHSDVDAFIIAITPYFYPQVVERVVRAGKHIYCEKPVATDVAGCLKIIDIGRKIDGKLVFHVGLNVRSSPSMKEMVRRMHAGAIGEIVTGESFFYWGGGAPRQRPPGSLDEARIRHWTLDRILSGDYIVEQNVHSMDKINWILRNRPLAAVATGGRKVKADWGDNWDHYVATLYYPDNVAVSFRSTQFLKGWTDAGERFFGSRGVSDSHYVGGVRIYGEDPWDSGVKEILTECNVHNVQDFIRDIQTRNMRNDAVRGAESTLTSILVRMAAYSRQEVTWDEMVSSNQTWDPNINLKQFT